MSSNNNPIVSNPNDFKVIEFHNSEDFTFTPEMGCMFDGRPIFGISGAPGINAGESLTLPYHIGHRLAMNLAKQVQLRKAPAVDPTGIPTGVVLWNPETIEALKNSFIKELYVEEKPLAMTETDRLMAKVEEYKAMVEKLVESKASDAPATAPVPEAEPATGIPAVQQAYQDKQEIITELEKRGIPHDKRASKANLEKLLLPVAAS